MAKSAKHKKLRKQEKAKTKLRGSKLAKPQNVVEPKLKSKKILIREQLKSSTSGSKYAIADEGDFDKEIVADGKEKDYVEATTSKKQSIQDILTSLNHQNKNIKKDALNGLTEIVRADGELLIANLSRVLEKIGSLTSDLENIVRRENLRVTEVIFAQLKEDQVEPFWNLLLTHVKCTLTNLNATIRYNCLSFLALLISYFPNLTAKSYQIILPNLLNLISTTSTVDSSQPPTKSKPAKPMGYEKKSKLKMEISENHNVSTQRLRVLSLIASCLDLAKPKRVKIEETARTKFCEPENIDQSNFCNPYGYQEFKYGTQESLGLNKICLGADFGKSSENDNFWPQFVDSCLPILWETWLEVKPSLKDDNTKVDLKGQNVGRGISSLPSLTVEYLECIITVMSRLILANSKNQINDSDITTGFNNDNDMMKLLRKHHGQNLTRYFFNGLPFSAIQNSQKKIISNVNLDLFHIAAQLRLVDANLMNSLDSYIKSSMSKAILDSSQTNKVLSILTLLHMERVETLISEVINYALNCGYFDSVNIFLLHALSPTTENENLRNFTLKAVDWDNVVQQLLVQSSSITSEGLKILTLIALRRLASFSEILTKNFDKLQHFINDAEETYSSEAWNQTIRLFYSLDCLEFFNQPKIYVPESVQDVINQLLSWHTCNTEYEK